MRRMSRFLKLCAFVFTLVLTGPALGAGYTCPAYVMYNSCNAGYYMTGTSSASDTTCNATPVAGNDCKACPSGQTCAGGTACPQSCTPCSATNASCSVSVSNNTCVYTTACNSGYGNIQNNGKYNPSCSALTYNVTLDQQSGSGGTGGVTPTFGSAMPAATMPKRSGYVFGGYYTEVNGGGTQYYTAAGGSARAWDIANGRTLYAKWTQCTQCAATGGATCTVSTVNNTCTYTTSCPAGYTISGNGTATPSCTANKYTVTLNKQSGTGGSDSVQVTYNAAMPGATMPTRAGYVFGGYYDLASGGTQYYTAAGGSAQAWNKVGDSTLYARWSACQVCAPGTGANCSMSVVGNVCTYTTSCKTGYEGLTNSGKYNPSCTPSVYAITLSPQSGTGGTATVYQKYATGYSLTNFGGLVTSITPPTRTNHTFSGFYTATSGGTQRITAAGVLPANTTFTAPTTVYAQWSACQACAAGNGASCSLSVVGNVCTYTTSCLPGYAGLQNAGKYNPYCSAGSYTLTLSKDGGVGGPDTVSATYGGTVTPATITIPTKSGSVFKGYYSATSGGTQFYTAAGAATSATWTTANNGVLYAQWTACAACAGNAGVNCTMSVVNNACAYTTSCKTGYGSLSGNGTANATCTPNKYTVTLSAPEATTAGTASVSATYDAAMPSATMPKRTNYTFGGFYDATSGGTQYYTATGASARTWNKAQNATLNARWTACTPCNPGVGATCTLSVVNNACTYTTACTTGYKDIQNGGTATAYCIAKTYTVMLDKQNGTGGPATITVTYGAAMPATTMPTRANHSFEGYYDATSGGTQYFTASGASARTWNKDVDNSTLYARWALSSVNCAAGSYLPANATACSACTNGNYCGGGLFPMGVASDQGLTKCPGSNPGSDGNRNSINSCYQSCPSKTISNGTATNVQDKVYYSGSAYGTCTYTANCNADYNAIGSPGADPKCVFAGACPPGYFCPPGVDEPQACPGSGTSDLGEATTVTECYIVRPHPNFDYGTANQTCYYNAGFSAYDNCIKFEVLTCNAGYYWESGQACTAALNGYYSPAPDVQQTQCPAGANGSDAPRDKYQNCFKNCSLTVPNSTSVTAVANKVYSSNGTSYPACSYSVICKTGYTVKNNNSAAPSCEPNVYTITLDKNGGSGSTAASVNCTFDSGSCTLPVTTALSRPGYTVAAQWCSDQNGGAPCYAAGTSITSNISANGTAHRLYAKWTPNIYTVNLDHQAATTAGAPATVYLKYATGWYSNSAATTAIDELTTAPKKTGYHFVGYYTKVNGQGTQVIAANKTFMNSSAALSMTTSTPATIYASWVVGTTSCPAGQYYTGSACMDCPAGSYCPGGDFGTESGQQGLNSCPNGGSSEAKSSDESKCYKTGLNYSATNGAGTQACFYTSGSGANAIYNTNCYDKVINRCNEGYYYTTGVDCTAAGIGYYSPEDEKSRQQCPNGGTTATATSGTIQQCYKAGLDYTAANGSGTQTCFYSSGTGTSAVYNNSCHTKRIDRCRAGFWRENTMDEDCSMVGRNYYSGENEITRTLCPNDGKTSVENATGAGQCYKEGELYVATHGQGIQTCFLDANKMTYTVCQDITITSCNAGYYRQSASAIDCIEAGIGYYSPVNLITRTECENGGTTETTTSTSATMCYKEAVFCPIANGSGENTCFYTSGSGTGAIYDTNCSQCIVVSCDTGTSQVGNACIACPENFVCTAGEQQSCAELGDGSFVYSDAGTTNVAGCYKTCALGTNAAKMKGRDYYMGADTCEIDYCAAGFQLVNGQCRICPAGSYCDGTGSGNNGAELCSAVGDGTWSFSAAGSTSSDDCYTQCKGFDVNYGNAIPDNVTEFHPDQCTFTCISDTGNAGEIVNDTCVEMECRSNYEMINGVCQLCQRENALSYKPGSNCEIETCIAGYHPNGQMCEENVVDCTAPHAEEAYKTWDNAKKAYGICTIKSCEAGYHVSSNACVIDEQECVVENGRGFKEWDPIKNKWGECVVEFCNPGFTFDPFETNEQSKPCGACKNKYSVLGELAVSSYTQGCEIASCMYQGEMYNLEGNECVPICDVNGYEDETGTMKWNPSTKKCVRQCKEGFTMW